MLDYPQLCVIGDQTDGKSTLLEDLTGVEFPTGTGTVTRAATVVNCKPNETEEFEVNGEFCMRDKLQSKLSKAQDKLFGKDKNERKRNLKNGIKVISMEPINVKARGPEQINIQVVDLPGLIHSGPGKEETRELIRKYITPEQTFILLVSEAKKDDQGLEAIEIAKSVDPQGLRTMRILTKFDNFSDLGSKRKAVERIVEGMSCERGPRAVALRPDGRSYDQAKEKEIFEKASVPVARAGIHALRESLPAFLADRMKTNLPKLENDVRTQLKEAQAYLKEIGENGVGKDVMRKEYQTSALDMQFTATATEHLETFQESIANTKSTLTRDWVNERLKHDAFSMSFFQGEKTVKRCMAEITEIWRNVMETYIEALEETILDELPGVSYEISKRFSAAVREKWETYCNNVVFPNFEKRCEEVLMMEKDFGTINHYLESKYKEEKIFPDIVIEEALGSVQQGDYCSTTDKYCEKTGRADGFGRLQGRADDFETVSVTIPRDHETVIDKFRRAFKKEAALHLKELEKKPLREQQLERVHAALEANYDVEKKTFTDNIMKITRIHLVDVRENWLREQLLLDEELSKQACEDEDVLIERRTTKDKISKMEKCMKEIHQLHSKLGC